MKRTSVFLPVVGAVILAGVQPVRAVPVGSSNDSRDYMIAARQLGNWSCGTLVYAEQRSVTAFGSGSTPMNTSAGLAFLGYDVARWITFYGLAGGSEYRFGRERPPITGIYGAGLHFNLFDHDLMDPTLFEDRVRLNADCHATYTVGELRGRRGVELLDINAAVTGSIVNDLEGHKFFVPRSIALFAGPVYASVQNPDRTVRTVTPFGVMAGLEMYWSPKMAWHIGAQSFNGRVQPRSGLNIRF